MKLWIIVASTERAGTAVANLKKYGKIANTAIRLFVHESEKELYRAVVDDEMFTHPDFEIWTHNISKTSTKIPMGGIRFHSMRRTQQRMDFADAAILADDDLLQFRFEDGRRKSGKGLSFISTGYEPLDAIERLVACARAARQFGLSYFTTSFDADAHGPHNNRPGYQQYRAVWAWSGLIGFFKTSPNPFDPEFGIGADLEARFRILENKPGLDILEDIRMVAEFQIIGAKYAKKLNILNRNGALQNITKRYTAAQTTTNLKQVVLQGKKIEKISIRLNRKILNQFKNNVPVEIR